MNRTKNALRGIGWGIINKILTIVMPFVLRTVILYKMGGLYLGINGLFSSILNVLNLTELGISSAIVFSMYAPIANNDDSKVRKLLFFYKRCYQIIGSIIAFCGIIILPFLSCFIAGDYPKGINIYIVYLIHLLSVVISYLLFAYKRSLFQACQRNDVLSNINSIIAIIQYGLQIFIIIMLNNYYAYIIVMPITVIFNNIATAYISKKMYPQYYPDKGLDEYERRSIWHKVKGLIYQKLGSVILTSVDSIVISSFLGLNILAVYQNYNYIITSVIGILDVVFTVLVSGIGNTVAKETLDYNYDMFKKINMSYILFVSICTTIMGVMMNPFMILWVGNSYLLSNVYVILFAVYFFVYKWCDVLNIYQNACGIWYETRYVPLLASVSNLVINIILVKIIGLSGVLISTIISFVFVYNLLYAKYIFMLYFKKFDKGLHNFISRQFTYMLICICVSLICEGLSSFIYIAGIVGFVLKGLLISALAMILYYFIYRNFSEFSFIRDKVELIMINVRRKE